jgi:4-amino-4-deoxy-L-arabinose transferase-like glycosyltransferase
MPGFVWLARVAMLETALVFFSVVSMLFFFLWLQKHQNRFLLLSGLVLGLGFLAKYQILVSVIAMVASVFLVGSGYLKARLSRFPFLVLTAVIVVVPWILFAYQTYSTGMLDQWLYALNTGNPQKSVYSLRYPTPIFYLIEMVWTYGVKHPISFLVYGLSLAGIGFFVWRRKPQDKFLAIWFFSAYLFFTLISNREWRYMVAVFPVLAISAASLVAFTYGKAAESWKGVQISLKRARLLKIAAAGLIALTIFAVAYSCMDAYAWVENDNAYNLPMQQASEYAVARLEGNESLALLCPLNLFNSGIIAFYVAAASQGKQTPLWQYPKLPVDTYKPNFNVTELATLCEAKNARYLLLFEYGETYPYFDTDLTMQSVYEQLLASGRFSIETSFGEYPTKIFVLSFNP